MRIIEFGLYLKSLEESLKGFKQTHDIISGCRLAIYCGRANVEAGSLIKKLLYH